MQLDLVNNGYANLFQDVVDTQTKEIKKAMIMEELGLKVAMASLTADSILPTLSGYEIDSIIPEDSTVSFHI